jgi:hypothetical protein
MKGTIMKRLWFIPILLMLCLGSATATDWDYKDGIICNTLTTHTIQGVWGNWSISESGNLTIDSVTTGVLNQPLDLSQASLTLSGALSVGTTSTLTGAVDCVAALTCATIVSDASVEATTTVTAGTSLAVGTSADVVTDLTAGTIVSDASVEATTTVTAGTSLAVGTSAVVTTSLTSATYNFADATAVAGAADAITIDFTPDMPAAVAGMRICYVSEFLNTGATTINIDGAGAVNVYDSADVGACAGGEIVDNMCVDLMFDGTQWQLMNTAL